LGSCCCLLIFQSPLFAQTLHISPVTASPGEQVALEISFTSPPGREPSTLQWETSIPIAQLSFLEESLSPGPSARTAGKSLNCRVKTGKTAGTQTSACILFGGQEPIHDGVVAVLHLKVLAGITSRTPQIHIDQALAVTKNLNRYPLPPVKTVVRIHRK
jgi:hypothetical protein